MLVHLARTGIQDRADARCINSDPVTHNIHPRPHLNREWNQSQDPGTEPLVRLPIREDRSRSCNIQRLDARVIGVVDSPYFAVIRRGWEVRPEQPSAGELPISFCRKIWERNSSR